ncbi:MAG: hypothetical protein IKO01_02735 [Kiritimatiellae bacterium]|nr:hypothetical protein [Kiritimatiellia bacterium]
MNLLLRAARKTQPVYDIASGLFTGPGAIGLAFLPLVLGVTTTAFLGVVATETGRAILDGIRRHGRGAAPRPAVPSLRGAPTAAELESDATAWPRTLAIRLRLGSRLADLEPVLDRGIRRKGKTGCIRGRAGGMKAYIADACLSISYRTLMRYKLLAVRLRQLLALDPRLPLEWLLPGAAPDRDLPSDLRAPYAAARRRLSRLLRANPNVERLRKHVDAHLGIPELLTVRRTARRAKEARKTCRRPAARRPLPRESAVFGDYTVTFTPARLDATRCAFARILGTPDLPPELAVHRDRFLAWLGTEDSNPRSVDRR